MDNSYGNIVDWGRARQPVFGRMQLCVHAYLRAENVSAVDLTSFPSHCSVSL